MRSGERLNVLDTKVCARRGLRFLPGSSMLNTNERQASSLIGLVLTQAALLSFPHDEPG
mgnify:CR=1 FL=1